MSATPELGPLENLVDVARRLLDSDEMQAMAREIDADGVDRLLRIADGADRDGFDDLPEDQRLVLLTLAVLDDDDPWGRTDEDIADEVAIFHDWVMSGYALTRAMLARN